MKDPDFRLCRAIALTACLTFPAIAWSESIEDTAARIVSELQSGTLDDTRIRSLSPSEQAEALSWAVQVGDRGAVEKLLEIGISPDAPDAAGMVPLYRVVAFGDRDLAELLLAAGADPHAASDSLSPLELARAMGSRDMIALLAPEGDAGDLPQMLLAAADGDAAWMEMLISEGAHPDLSTPDGWSVMHEAVAAAQPEVVEILLDAGASVDALDKEGVSPLGVAIAVGASEIARRLLVAGADPNLHSMQLPPLSIALVSQNDELLEALIDAGADPALPGQDGVVPVMVAMALGKDQWVDILGGVPGAAPNLISAILGNDEEAVKAALEAGADPDQVDREGTPALLLAAAFGSREVVTALLGRDPNLFATSASGASVVHAAYSRDDKDGPFIAREIFHLTVHDLGRLLAIRDANGRSAFVASASVRPERGQHPLQWAIMIGASSTNSQSIAELLNRPDDDGMTPYLAAVLADNAGLVGVFARALRVAPEPVMGGVSLQDAARARANWNVLRFLPDDRSLPDGLHKGGLSRAVLMDLQHRLRNWGYYNGEIDGLNGPRTRSAMMAMMQDRMTELEEMWKVVGPQGTNFVDTRLSYEFVPIGVRGEGSSGTCQWRLIVYKEHNGFEDRFIACSSEKKWDVGGVVLEILSDGPVLRLTGRGGSNDYERF